MSQKTVTIKKTNAEKRIVYGEVYIPMVPDSQGEFMTAAEIEKMAHRYMMNGHINKFDVEHSLQPEEEVYTVESFIARPGDPDFIEGSWVIGSYIPNDEAWGKVVKGEINAFSMWGTGFRTERVLEVELPEGGVVKGETFPEDAHEHTFHVSFAEDGTFLGGETNEVNGHKHKIAKGTATELAEGHRHRYALVDAIVKSAICN